MSNPIETGFTFTVYADYDYKYTVVMEDTYTVNYKENDREEISIGFGSIEEMEAVARSMLKAVEVKRELDRR